MATDVKIRAEKKATNDKGKTYDNIAYQNTHTLLQDMTNSYQMKIIASAEKRLHISVQIIPSIKKRFTNIDCVEFSLQDHCENGG